MARLRLEVLGVSRLAFLLPRNVFSRRALSAEQQARRSRENGLAVIVALAFFALLLWPPIYIVVVR